MPARTLQQSLRELRRLARGASRRQPRPSEALSLLTAVLSGADTLSIEERAGGVRLHLLTRDGSMVCAVTCMIQDAKLAVRFTPCEQAVASHLCEGLTLAQIARLRGVSINTIKSQVRQVFRKLNVDSRVALIRRLGL